MHGTVMSNRIIQQNIAKKNNLAMAAKLFPLHCIFNNVRANKFCYNFDYDISLISQSTRSTLLVRLS